MKAISFCTGFMMPSIQTMTYHPACDRLHSMFHLMYVPTNLSVREVLEKLWMKIHEILMQIGQLDVIQWKCQAAKWILEQAKMAAKMETIVGDQKWQTMTQILPISFGFLNEQWTTEMNIHLLYCWKSNKNRKTPVATFTKLLTNKTTAIM